MLFRSGRTREAVEYFNDVQISDEVNQFMDNADPSFIDVLASDLSDEQYKEWETCFRRDFDQQFSVAQMIVLFATKSFADYIQTRSKLSLSLIASDGKAADLDSSNFRKSV